MFFKAVDCKRYICIMKKPHIARRIINRFVRCASFCRFKFKYPRIKIINPLKIGTFYSQEGQDFFLSSLLFNYLNQNANSWVVDVGCNHPSLFSNSLVFEKWFGCRVLAIDPLEEFGSMWASERPSAIFVTAAIGGTSDTIELSVPQGELADNMFSSVAGGVNKAKNLACSVRTVPCLKLADILSSHNINEVLLMSIDVEGVELGVLKTIDFEKVMVRCIVLENNSTNLYGSNEVRDYLIQNGYLFIARIGFLDDIFVHSSMINCLPNDLLY